MSTNNHATVCGCVHVRDIINPLLLLLLTWSNIICFFVYMQACWNHTAAVRLWYLQCVWTAVLIRSRDRWWPSPSSMDLQIDTLTHLITILTVLTTVTHSGFVADRSWSCFCTRQTFIMSTNQRDGDGEGEDDGDGTDMNCDGHDEVGAWGSKRAGLSTSKLVTDSVVEVTLRECLRMASDTRAFCNLWAQGSVTGGKGFVSRGMTWVRGKSY